MSNQEISKKQLKLSFGQAAILLREARGVRAANPSLRFGQALFNQLPHVLYKQYTGTDVDFFYWEDEEKVMSTFWNEYVNLSGSGEGC